MTNVWRMFKSCMKSSSRAFSAFSDVNTLTYVAGAGYLIYWHPLRCVLDVITIQYDKRLI